MSFGFAKLMSQEILLAMFSIARFCGPHGLPQAVARWVQSVCSEAGDADPEITAAADLLL